MSWWSDPRRRRWVVWGALAGVFALVSLYRLSTAVLAERLMRAFDATGVELGTLHAAFFYIYAALQLPAGALADRFGTRWTAGAGAVVMNLGAVAFAASATYPAAFAARAAIGLGASVLYVSILRVGASWFRADEFATLNGLTIAVAGVGGVLATTPLAVAAARLGWRTTVFGIGAAGVALAGVALLVVRDSPEAAGLEPIAGVESRRLTLREVAANARTVAGELETWLIGVVLFCTLGVNITLLGLWGVPYVVQTYGLSVTRASGYTLLGSVGLALGAPALGWLSDRLGRRTDLMVAVAVLFTASLLALAVAGTPPLAVVAAVYFLVSVLTGGASLGYAVVKERHAAAASGVSTGTANTAAYAGAALVPVAMGAALDAFWTGETVAGARVYTVTGYRVAFAIAAGAGAVTVVCSLWLHRRHG